MSSLKITDVGMRPGMSVHLLTGETKSLLIDADMPHFGPGITANVEKVLGDRPLDYIMLSHSHYDHIGAVGALKTRYPNVIVCAHEYAEKVLKKDSAQSQIKALSMEAADEQVGGWKEEFDFPFELYQIDRVISEGDVIDIDGHLVRVIETPGHTKCSVAFYVEPDSILFMPESVGVFVEEGFVASQFVSQYLPYMRSIERLEALNAKTLYSAHSGLLEKDIADKFFKWSKENADKVRDVILDCYAKGESEEATVAELKKNFYVGLIPTIQPPSAFEVNAIFGARAVIRDCIGENAGRD